MSILFSEAATQFYDNNKRFKKELLTQEQQEVLDLANNPVKSEMNKIIEDNKAAKYKIQITFNHKRKNWQTTPCTLTCWESAGNLNEDNDKILFLCRAEKDPRLGCGFPFLEEPKRCLINGFPTRVFECKNCPKKDNDYRLILATAVSQIVYFNLPPKKLALKIYDYFRKLESNADIYIKYFKDDFRGGVLTDNADFVIYPLERIIKDSTNNSLVLKNIETFLSS